jgi:hypothetical protein
LDVFARRFQPDVSESVVEGGIVVLAGVIPMEIA